MRWRSAACAAGRTLRTRWRHTRDTGCFRDRALVCDPPPDLSDTASLVSILEAVEGNALGIELTAARLSMPLMSLKRIAEGLRESRLKWQRTERDDTRVGATSAGTGRHESLEACLDWSYRLLPEEEQRALPAPSPVSRRLRHCRCA